MGLFSKNKKEASKANPFGEMPSLPSLPKLPDFPRLDDSYGEMSQMHRLPSFPSNSLGTKFSQDTIKEAVTGEEEGDMDSANEFASDEDEDTMRMMQNPMMRPFTEEIGLGFRSSSGLRKSTEPVFIRIDKFEEALKIFNEAKRKISEIEHVLQDIKSVKEKEDAELRTWENEVKSMKDQISKVDSEIFSKI